MDIRPEVGASATIITEYLQAANFIIPPFLATALFYGIKTDTLGLGRGAAPDDTVTYFYFQPKVDVEALVQIEHAQVPATYFNSLTVALKAARLYYDLIVSYIGLMKYPDLGAEISDLLLRLEGAKWAICMGVWKDDFIVSIRSRSRKVGAGILAQNIIGDLGSAGGYGTMAGGKIQLNQKDPYQLSEQCKSSLVIIHVKG